MKGFLKEKFQSAFHLNWDERRNKEQRTKYSSTTHINTDACSERGSRHSGSVGEKIQNWMNTSADNLVTEEKSTKGSTRGYRTTDISDNRTRYSSRKSIGDSRTSLLFTIDEHGATNLNKRKTLDYETSENAFTENGGRSRSNADDVSSDNDMVSSGYCSSLEHYNEAIQDAKTESKPKVIENIKKRSLSEGESGKSPSCDILPDSEASERTDRKYLANTHEYVENCFKKEFRSNSANEVIYQRELTDDSMDVVSKSCNNINLRTGSHSNIMINTSGAGSSVSEPSRSASMIINHGPSNANRSRDHTRCQMHQHKKEGGTVLTKAVECGIRMISEQDTPRVALLLGHQYDGKTSTGKNILCNLPDAFDKAQKSIILSHKEWERFNAVDKTSQTVIFIDDMLGTKAFDEKKYKKWEPYLNELLSMAKSGRLSIVIAMNKRVYQTYVEQNSCHELFAKEFIIDLTNEYTYTVDEKIEILKVHLSRFPGAENIRFCAAHEDENIDSFRKGGDLLIAITTLKGIAEEPCAFGFPKQAKEYAASIEHICMRSAFFCRPLDFYCITIENLQKYTTQIFAAAIVYQHKGTFDMEQFTRSQKKRKTQEKYIPKEALKKKHRNGGNPPMIQDLASSLEEPQRIALAVSTGAMQLNNWILQFESEDTITFRSKAIHNAVGIVCSKRYKLDAIRYAPQQFILNFIGSNRRDGDRCITIDKHTSPYALQEFMHRLANEAIINRSVYEVCMHDLMAYMWFASSFLDYLQKEKKTSDFLHAKDIVTGETVLYHGMARPFHKHKATKDSDPLNLTEMIVVSKIWKKFAKDPILKKRQEIRSLSHACELGLNTTFTRLHQAHHPVIDIDLLEKAVLAGSVEIVSYILKARPCFQFSHLCKVLSVACKTFCKTNPTLGKRLAKTLLIHVSIDGRSKGNPPIIHDAVEQDNSDLLILLHELDCSLEIMNEEGERPLHTCARNGSSVCAKLLLRYGADPKSKNRNEKIPLHIAIEYGKLEMCNLLAEVKVYNEKGDKPDQSITCIEEGDSNRMRPIHLAIKHWTGMDILSNLIGHKADVNSVDVHGQTPLHIAIRSEALGKQQVEVVAALLTAGASIHKTDHKGETPIRMACLNKNTDIVEILLDNHINQINEDNELPFIAIEQENQCLLMRLLENRSHFDFLNTMGDSMLAYAIKLKQISIAKYLIEAKKANVNFESNGHHPLHIAIMKNAVEICKILINNGASMLAKNGDSGKNALHYACQHSNLDIVDLLLNETRLPLMEDKKGRTPLHTAAKYGTVNIVKRLLDLGSNPNARETRPEYRTPYQLALRQRNDYCLVYEINKSNIEICTDYDNILSLLRKAENEKRHTN